jgi:hypothetical protein
MVREIRASSRGGGIPFQHMTLVFGDLFPYTVDNSSQITNNDSPSLINEERQALERIKP